MKFWEAMKHLDEGLAVRRIDLIDPLLPGDIQGSEYEMDLLTPWELYSTPISFSQVVEGLKKGRKFRRPIYIEDSYILLKKTRIIWNNGGNFPISIQDIEASDWVEVNEDILYN